MGSEPVLWVPVPLAPDWLVRAELLLPVPELPLWDSTPLLPDFTMVLLLLADLLALEERDLVCCDVTESVAEFPDDEERRATAADEADCKWERNERRVVNIFE